VILNKSMSLVVVASALLFRTRVVPLDTVLAHWPIVVNLLAGSLLGAWFGAAWATRQIAAIRGAVNGLMSEVLEGHIREHLGAQETTEVQRTEDLEVVVAALRSYLK
jgi:predicted membrane protein